MLDGMGGFRGGAERKRFERWFMADGHSHYSPEGNELMARWLRAELSRWSQPKAGDWDARRNLFLRRRTTPE